MAPSPDACKHMARDPRVDAYIERAAPFAQPILAHVRALVHQACPRVEESIKWGMPHFSHAGAILCGMAEVVGEGEPREGMGSYGKIASLADLPPDPVLLAHIRRAVALNEDGGKAPAVRKAVAKPQPQAPADLVAALAQHPAAQATFDAFPPGCRREYIEWIVEARRPEIRAKRLAQALEWMGAGKRRNWKYERC